MGSATIMDFCVGDRVKVNAYSADGARLDPRTLDDLGSVKLTDYPCDAIFLRAYPHGFVRVFARGRVVAVRPWFLTLVERAHYAAPDTVVVKITPDAYAVLDCFMASGHPAPSNEQPFDGRAYLFTFAEIDAMRALVGAVRAQRPDAGRIPVRSAAEGGAS